MVDLVKQLFNGQNGHSKIAEMLPQKLLNSKLS